MNLIDIARRAYKHAAAKGFWHFDHTDAIVGTKIALVHTEISEALEAYRTGKPHDDPHGMGYELADAIIRIGDIAEFLHIDLDAIVAEKLDKNDRRPYRHGGKKF